MSHIINTHGHPDHTNGNARVSRDDAARLSLPIHSFARIFRSRTVSASRLAR